ncbi:hypothetical protein CPB83DRAFT_864143 [Crepidotus variabilis]|uniref:Microbial-type PARG catalytic domain-containing protein n=1 Tax=Crepidotus variabilis TaxID=179855 RepID=A0A9P6E500_9AGAR|nr:hypothetical protein CPB83DRAFT_864143 [Crepidotus variabilis]
MSLLYDQNDNAASGSEDGLDVPGGVSTNTVPKTAPPQTTSFTINLNGEREQSSSSRLYHHHNSQSLTSHQSLPHLPHGPYSARYYPRHPSYRLTRDDLKEVATTTLQIIDRGVYWPPGKREGLDEPYNLKQKIQDTIMETAFYAPDDEGLSGWAERSGKQRHGGGSEEVESKPPLRQTKIVIGEYSTLVGARKLYDTVNAGKGDKDDKDRIGVLNFASAKKPGGGFINGAQAQEESIARSSTLYPSLMTSAAKQFYRFYGEDPDNAFYTHAMVYSPSVVLFRNDKGNFRAPIEVDILTSAAVNAGDVRKQVRWEEEMRELRERVRVAELSRTKAAERVQREQDVEDQLWKVEREAYEEKERQDVAQDGEDKKKTAPIASSRSPSSIIHVDGSDTVNANGETCAVDASRSDSSQQLSPIIFANDPDPLPPPIQLQPSSSSSRIANGGGSSGPIGLTQYHSQNSLGSHQSRMDAHHDPLELAELQIASEMHERVARILCLFQQRGVKHLVLGSFGTGVFQNSIELVAGIFKDLLCATERESTVGGEGILGHAAGLEKSRDTEEDKEPSITLEDEDETKTPTQVLPSASVLHEAPFKNVFSTVMFAILGGSTVRTFEEVLEGEEGVEIDEDGEGSDVDAMKDLADVKNEDRPSFFVSDGRAEDTLVEKYEEVIEQPEAPPGLELESEAEVAKVTESTSPVEAALPESSESSNPETEAELEVARETPAETKE